MSDLRSLPGPWATPRTLAQLMFDPYQFYETNTARYGDRFRINLPPHTPTLITSRAADRAPH